MSSETKNCYNCGKQISIYDSVCISCHAAHEPSKRIKKAPHLESISAWLESLELEKYLSNFEDNAVTVALLPGLTDDDLKSIGVDKLGDRKNILAAAKTLADAPVDAAKAWIKTIVDENPVSKASSNRKAKPRRDHDPSPQKPELTSALGIGLIMIFSSLFLPMISAGISFPGYQIAQAMDIFGNFSDSPAIKIVVGLMWLMWLCAAYSLVQLHSGKVHRTSAYLSSLIPIYSALLSFAGALFRNLESLFDDPGQLIEGWLDGISGATNFLGIGAYCIIVGSIVVLKQLRKTDYENLLDDDYLDG